MIKLIDPSEFNFDQPVASLVEVHRGGVDKGWLRKSAAVLTKEMSEIKPEKGKTFMHLIALGDMDRYGCFAAGAKVALPDGTHVNIEDIDCGSYVLSANKKARQVLTTYERVVRSVIALRAEGIIDDLIVSENHPFIVAKRDQFTCIKDKYKRCLPNTFKVQNICKRGKGCKRKELKIAKTRCEARDIQLCDYLTFDTNFNLPVPRKLSVDECELIGIWLAEGSIQYNANKQPTSLRFSCGQHEKYTLIAELDRLAFKLQLNMDSYDYNDRRHYTAVCVTGNPVFAQEIHDWFGAGAHNKRIPLWVCSLPRECKEALLRGYFSGDGTIAVSDKENRIAATTVSYDLAVGIQRLCWNVDVPATAFMYYHNTTKGADPDSGIFYRLAISAASVPFDIGFTGRELKQPSKSRLWVKDGVAYIPVREISVEPRITPVFNLEVDADHTYICSNVGSHNCNRNGDSFPKEANMKYHDTFVKHANFYKHHKNKPHKGDKIYGQVKYSAYNPEMSRVELIIAIDNNAAPDTIEKIASGQDLSVSMACVVPFDSCSICGNKARNSKEYCDHITKHASQILSDGRQVSMINTEPKFFDISEVARNADRIAFTLRKVASTGSIIFSSDIADEMGITVPLALREPRIQKLATLLTKLAHMEDELMHAVKSQETMSKLAHKLSIPIGISTGIADNKQLRSALYHLKQADVSLPMEDFFHLAMGEKYAEIEPHIPGAKRCLPGIYKACQADPETFLSGVNNYEPLDKPLENGIKQVVKTAQAKGSLTDDAAGRLSISSLLFKQASVVRYNSAPVTKAERYLAQEYARYKLAFLEDKDAFVTKMSLLQNF